MSASFPRSKTRDAFNLDVIDAWHVAVSRLDLA